MMWLHKLLHIARLIKDILRLFMFFIVVEKVDDYSEVNYSLTKAPVFTSTYIETDHKVNQIISTFVSQKFLNFMLQINCSSSYYESTCYPRETIICPSKFLLNKNA